MPGAGKTTLLLELTRDLIERAREDITHPIPVVFNLTSRALKRSSISKWLVDELNQRYDVSRKIAQIWVENEEILPLLDGLDEDEKKHRFDCIEAINLFHDEHGLLPMVVCSRSADYEALTNRLRFSGSVTIQPLTREQVKEYLERAGTTLSGVYAAVNQDESLWDLLDTPLMLSMLALAHQGRMESVARIASLKGSLEKRRAALFDAYIEAMFARRNTTASYTPEQTRRWLAWLAKSMVKNNQSVFLYDWMLPNYKPKWMTKQQKFDLFKGLVVLGLIIWIIL